MTDFAVVGGGIIGLLLARRLAHAGANVTLFDRQSLGRESSWAGGGILSPLYPWRYPAALNQLVDWRSTNFQQLAQALWVETGIDSEVNCCGVNMLNASDENAALDWASHTEGAKSGLQLMTVDALKAQEPLLGEHTGINSVLTLPHVGNVRNPRLLKALLKSLENTPNVTLKADCAVQSFIHQGSRVIGVNTSQGACYADESIVAAGAWSADLLKTLNVSLPVYPVKGQMLLIKARPALLNSVILTGACYLIPRNDGRILIGSTVEQAAYDKTPTAAAKQQLLAAAYHVAPALARYPLEHHWAGLRPSSPEGIPFIGRLPEWQGISLCTGHFRNGVVTAPESVNRLVTQLINNA